MSQGIRRVPSNTSQNRMFRDATRGLNKAQKERIRREVEQRKKQYEDLDYAEIKELADKLRGTK
jgi:hypothetical protein